MPTDSGLRASLLGLTEQALHGLTGQYQGTFDEGDVAVLCDDRREADTVTQRLHDEQVTTPEHNIFISYPSPDQAFANDLRRFLQQHGFPCFIDAEELLPAMRESKNQQNYMRGIDNALKSCTHFLLLISPRVFQTRFQPYEFQVASFKARQGKLKVIPLLLDGVDLAELHNAFPTLLLDHAITWRHALPSAELLRAFLDQEVSQSEELDLSRRDALIRLLNTLRAIASQRSLALPSKKATKKPGLVLGL